ncbi:bifunctional DNA primase/polymerase [Patescibacteria group bacterium]|nr:bifunctional DNA primase/polymerase [Candidatus Paceibacterota bacterium]MBP9710583.1 bifunctional DNA primase/polymerase [Patescibacteria group bacterium]
MEDNQVSKEEDKFPNANPKSWDITQWAECYAHEHKMSIAAYSADEKIRLGTRGKGTAPQPYEEVRRMFQVNPLLNIAMVPGENGIVVVDFDVKAAKADLDRAIEKDPAFLLLPETPSVDTPSGGMHFYSLQG